MNDFEQWQEEVRYRRVASPEKHIEDRSWFGLSVLAFAAAVVFVAACIALKVWR